MHPIQYKHHPVVSHNSIFIPIYICVPVQRRRLKEVQIVCCYLSTYKSYNYNKCIVVSEAILILLILCCTEPTYEAHN